MQRVDRYELRGELGRGGMGVVYRAWDPEARREVALKVLLGAARLSPEDLARFRAEAAAGATLQHPNIVRVRHAGVVEGLPYIVMDLAAGGSLAARVKAGPLPQDEAALVAEKLALALSHAHAAGVIHRDLKPANVLLDARGEPLLTDFGLALLTGGQRLTHSGDVVGTPQYMPPEQAQGERRQVGPWSDVYSLGATLYELLAGRPPYAGPSPMVVLAQVVGGPPRPLAQVRPGLDPGLVAICERALERAPALRYLSADDLARALAAWRAARRGGGPVAPARSRPAWPVAVGAAATAVAALALAGVAAARRTPTGAVPPAPAAATGTAAVSTAARAVEAAPAPLDEAARERALAEADLALERREDDPAAWLTRARLLRAAGHDEAARRDCDRALALAPDLAPARLLRAALRRWREPEGALEDVERAEAAGGLAGAEAAAAAGLRASLLGALGRAPAAEACVRRALALDPRQPDALLARGLLRVEAGEHEAALADLAPALAADPPPVPALLALHRAHHARGRDLDALRAALLAVRHAPTPEQAAAALELVQARTRDLVELLARARPEDVLREARGLRHVELALGLRLLEAGQVDEGLERVAAVLAACAPSMDDAAQRLVLGAASARIDAGDAGSAAWRVRALVRSQRVDHAGALADIDRALRRADDAPGRVLRAWVLLGRDAAAAEAEAALDEALRRDPGVEALPLYWTARAFGALATGRASDAVAATTRALALDPASARAHGTRAEALQRLGRLDLALEDARRAVALDPHDPLGYVRRARVLARLGRWSAAQDDLRTVEGAHGREPRAARLLQRLRARVEAQALADEALARGDRGAVLAACDGMVAGQEGDVEAWVERARMVERVDPRLALEALDRALALEPRHLEARTLRCSLLPAAERVADLQAIVDVDPRAHGHRARLGEALAEAGRLDEGLEAARAAAAGAGTSRVLADVLARAAACVILGDDAASRRALDLALRLDPDALLLLSHRGHLRRVAGDTAGSLHDLRRAAALPLRGRLAEEVQAELAVAERDQAAGTVAPCVRRAHGHARR